MVKEGFKKFKVKIREVIEHTYEVEQFNEHMAKEAGKDMLKAEQVKRVWHDNKDIFVEEIKE